MDSPYRPQSPDLSGYAPQSPDLSGLRPQTPEGFGTLPSPRFGHHHSHSRDRFGGAFANNGYGSTFGNSLTSAPKYEQPPFLPTPQQRFGMAPAQQFKSEDDEDDEYLPGVPPAKRSRKAMQPQVQTMASNGSPFAFGNPSQLTAPLQGMTTFSDPTLGVQLKTSFPVARIKRIMQADEDIGKVAQVTPHVVSRALELFMIKLISASATQARGGTQAGSGGGGSKGQKRILVQHMKKAIVTDETFDFLADIVAKVPDAPSKAKKETGSDSEDGAGGSVKVPRKKGKKRKDSGDDF